MEEKQNVVVETKSEEAAPKKEHPFKNWWHNKTTFSKITFCLAILLIVIGITFFFLWVYSRKIWGDTVGDQMLGEGIENGWVVIGNAMLSSGVKWMWTFVIILICIVFIFLASFIINLCSKNTRKSKTIGSLIKSLVKYLTVIIGIGFILANWGVDVAGIVAGVGVITLVVGLGCQTLIQDVVAGIFIVFDDYYSVGDIVIIDGFRGVVSEVGLKATKVTDFGGNIKSITNSSITTVVNLSRIDSMITVTIGCAYEEDVVRVEGIIEGAMEEFKAKIPAITDGPYYKGIDNIGASSVDFLVLCYAKEADRFQVTRDLKRELFLLFREHDIIIPYTQITVSAENDHNRPQATAADIALAERAVKRNRGIGKKTETKKKTSLGRKTVQALEKTNKELNGK